jgi:agmatine deiminase
MLAETEAVYIQMIRALLPGERVNLIVPDEPTARRVASRVGAKGAALSRLVFHRAKTTDTWIRDYGPLFVRNGREKAFAKFIFNAWGGKYADLARDNGVVDRLPALSVHRRFNVPVVLEGGSIDMDGRGTCLTTEQCLLNPNRNPQLTRSGIEGRLQRDLGFERVLWLGDGLINDHTDGHVDNLARFVAPNVLAVPRATGSDDPNAAIYADARARAEAFGVTVREVPSPGRVESASGLGGRIEPASYMNFAITSKLVVVPVYGTAHDADGVAAIAELFPDREVVGIMADAVLAGGGSFHCASQQMPELLQA